MVSIRCIVNLTSLKGANMSNPGPGRQSRNEPGVRVMALHGPRRGPTTNAPINDTFT